MATSPNYARLGFFIVIAGALIVCSLVWFGGMGGNKHEFLAETYFENPVSGLDVGSTVNFRGVKLGSVKRISFIGAEYPHANAEDQQIIWVQLAFDERLLGMRGEDAEDHLRDMVSRGIHATVSASGVTGLSHIEINFPKMNIKDRKISWKPRSTCIPPAPSILQSAADSAQRILGQIDRMNLLDAWTNLVTTIKNANSAMENADGLLSAERGNINEIIENLREASVSLRVFANEIRENPAALLRDNPPEPLDETR